MKKVTMLLSGLVLTGMTTFAQMSVEPEIGMNISNLSTKISDNDAEMHNAKIGLNAGVGLKFNITEGFYVKPGVYYSQQGAEVELLDFGSIAQSKSTFTTHYLQIPVSLGFQGGLNGGQSGYIFGEVSPYVGFGLSGIMEVETKVGGIVGTDKSDMDWGKEDNEYNPLDVGMKFAVGYETPWGIYLKGGYTLGLGNMSNIDDYRMNNRGWNISLGYSISL